MGGLIKHLWAIDGEKLPPCTSPFYEFVGAANGLFIRGQREGLEMCFKVGDVSQPVRGLATVEERLVLWYPKVPATHLQFVLEQSREVCGDGVMREILFHFTYASGTWQISIPEQDASGGHVRPTNAGHGSSYATSILEVHSHHSMAPFFSSMDDSDEQGFKLYGVIGHIFSRPALQLRVGLYGYFWQIPASWVFDMPDSVADAAQRRVRRIQLDEQTCQVCGCTDSRPCEPGCFWMEDDLCSECAPAEMFYNGSGNIDPATDLWVPDGIEVAR